MRYSLLFTFFFSISQTLIADALVVTKAMKAPVIAEFNINGNKMSLGLEISRQELSFFPNLIPNELRTAFRLTPKPQNERMDDFFENDMPIYVDGKVLKGKVALIQGRNRTSRDEISGQRLQLEEEGTVLFFIITYDLPDNCEELYFRNYRSPSKQLSTIGFACYHEGIMVNDFSYYNNMTLKLDREDPWYSKFKEEGLQRKQFSPIIPFIYADNYEVRKEIVARLVDLEEWIDLGLTNKTTLNSKDKELIISKVETLFMERNPVKIDGKNFQGSIEKIKFIQRGLNKTTFIPDEEEINTVSAMIGVIISYPVENLPKRVEMTWEFIPKKIDSVIGRTVDELGPFIQTLTKKDNILVWENFLTNPPKRGLMKVGLEPVIKIKKTPIFTYTVWVLGATFFIVFIFRKNSGKILPICAAACLGLGFLLKPYVHESETFQEAELNLDNQKTILSQLLYNIYRSFDLKKDEHIYDSLAHSADGDLLSDIFLDTKKALEIRSMAGSRVKVTKLDIEDLKVISSDEDSGNFKVSCDWNVTGKIGHWGHVHQRVNQYSAKITVANIGGNWKLKEFNLLSENRVMSNF